MEQSNQRGQEITGENDHLAPADDIPPIEPGMITDDGMIEPREHLAVIGLGGSAGSLDPLQTFFNQIKGSTGCAYVVVVHLSADHESAMAEILQRSTHMPVRQVTEPVKIRPDHVYVIPPGKHLSMTDGMLQTSEMVRQKGRHVTLDLFFRTLADTHGVKGTAIVLSGGDSDGTIGLKRVKERGGLTICQEPSEAEYDGMPRAAIATGMVDWVLPVIEIPGRLQQYRENESKIQLPAVQAPNVRASIAEEEKNESALREVLMFLKVRTGHDFAYYKRATILRRIGRRMQVNSTENLESYLAYLRAHPGETGALLQDLLISVTNFFRDKEAFATLEKTIPELFKNKGPNDQIRVWVPACATGEEAYSIAILLSEYAAKLNYPPQIQVFATDLDQPAIDAAREGRYSETIVADVSEDRLRQFFSKDSGVYRVRRAVREIVLFAMHDLLKDSPFSRLDLVSCRNLLIYLNRDAQQKVFDIFHFALSPTGYLFLGSSESAEEASSLFSPIDKKHRLYTRRSVHRVGLSVPAGSATLSFAYQSKSKAPPLPPQSVAATAGFQMNVAPVQNSWGDLHLRLIEAVSPPSLVITREYDIVHLSKSVGRFLQLLGGEPSINLLKLAHPQLRTELRAALFRASKTKSAVTIPGVPMDSDGRTQYVDISVQPAEDVAPDFLLVSFDSKDVQFAALENVEVNRSTDSEVVQHLEDELDQMRSEWKETVEQYEASTEELKASNEELQAMNEELRSATEELETGREELQSINEEIITINQELKSKVEELSRANSDLQNLMASTKIATIFLDRKLQINRFTPSTTGLFNFIPSDIGRPLSDLTHRLDYPQITGDAEKVLDDLSLVEREVRNLDGRWFLARMFPYRTTEDQIAGVVITCVDITERKQAEEASKWLSVIVESSNDAIISFTMDGHIVSWNRGAERVFGYASEETKGKSHAILSPDDRQSEVGEMLDQLRRGETIDQFETVQVRKGGQLIDVSLSASVMKNESGEIVGATAIIQDVTARKRAVEELKQARIELECRVEERTAELRQRVSQLALMASELTSTEQRERKRMAQILHDELQQLLVAAKMRIESMNSLDEEKRAVETKSLVELIDEALANSRSLAIDLSPPILAEGLGRALQWLCGTWMMEKYQLRVEQLIDANVDVGHDDLRNLIFLAVRELLFNVVKHSGVSDAKVELTLNAGEVRVIVSDSGNGFRERDPMQKSAGGSGFGLMGLRERLQMLGGELEITTNVARGVEVIITAPRDTIKEP